MEFVLKSHVVFEDESSFRQRVESKSKVATTDAEWSGLTQDWHPPYDDLDLAEMVNVVRRTSDQRTRSSPADKAGQGRRAHVERTARQPRQLVESFRMELFNHTYPPYPNRGADAAEWIESQIESPKTERLTIELTIPAHLKPMERVVSAINHLADNLGSWTSTGDGGGAVVNFMQYSGEVRDVIWSIPTLEYLGVNAEGEVEIKEAYAPDGTLLGRLRDTAAEIAKRLAWRPYAALHHLLTGGVVAHSSVQVSGRQRNGRQAFGDYRPMTLTISDPDTVTEKELTDAYRKAKSNNESPWSTGGRKRSRVASKAERVAAFVEGTTNLTWAGRLEEWNRLNPEDRYITVSGLKNANTRAKSRP